MPQVSDAKLRTVEQAVKLLKGYEVVCAADMFKLGSVMLQDLRRKLRGQIAIKCIKNTLMRIAMEHASMKNAEQFLNTVAGPNIFIFANRNPFKLAMTLNRDKVKVLAKPGDPALDGIVIPAGNTGLSPGPIIGKFGALGVRTRIEGGTIWVAQDTVVAKAGDKISEDLADILARLGIKAAEIGLSIKAAYDHDVVITGKELLLDLDSFREQLQESHSQAFQVALKSEYTTRQTVPILLAMAAQNARNISVEAEYITSETAKELIAKAHSQATYLEGLVQSRT